MIRFHALGINFRLPLFTLIIPLLAQKLGMQIDMAPLALALGIHELAHVLTAKLVGVAIQEIQILPFGGSARMENPYRLPLRQILPTAAAGPVANLSLAMGISALAHWNIVPAEAAGAFICPNLLLFVFNLFPALPLDGGRILFVILARILDEKKALGIGLWSGRILAAGLIGITLVTGLKHGVWNLSFVLSALFVLACGKDEKCAQLKSRAQQLSDLLTTDFDDRPARFYQLEASEHADKALSLLRPREPGWFMLTRKGKPAGMLGARELLDYLLNGGAPDTALENLLEFSFPHTQHTGAR